MQEIMWSNVLCIAESSEKRKLKEKTKQTFFEAYKSFLTENKFALFKLLKLIQVANNLHLLYLPYQLSSYHPNKELELDLQCPIVIK